MSSLPAPDADARAHSEALAALIHAQIAAEGGAIAFSRFMELALYAPGLGYYSAGATKFGHAGDFVTAPELGCLFASCIASALAPVLRQIGPSARFLEIGGGSGAFAEAALTELEAQAALPASYAILEPSADLRQRQQARLQARLPAALFARLVWLDGPIEENWQGVVFANEVLDALPASRFVVADEGVIGEEYVASAEDGSFRIEVREADILLGTAVARMQADLPAPLPPGYRSEILPQLPFWIQAVIGRMRRGALLFCDYGYPRAEFYQPDRHEGTLRAFRRHHLVKDVMAWPGLQDITASVDFTALAEAGVGAGFDLAGYCPQAAFLLGNGLEAHLTRAEALAADEAARIRLRNEAKALTLPEAMGERFALMGFAREVDFEPAFAVGEMSWRLG